MSKQETVTIKPANLKTVAVTIVGVAPYVQNKFSAKAREKMRSTQEAGSTSKKGQKKDPKDFEQTFKDAIHYSDDGWPGLPASGLRAALVSACRMAGFQMTKAKLSVFVEQDGFDATDQTPLVRITKGDPEYREDYVRNETGVVDIRPRPMFRPGWEAVVRMRYDADMFTASDVINLLYRAGMQVGIGEGRPDSKKSCGMGWGLFEIKETE